MRMLFFAHSGLRYLILLLGIAAILYYAYAVATKKSDDRPGRILGSGFVGAIDLQILIGLTMVALGLFYSALIGHLFMMILAAVVGHGAMAFSRKAAPERANGVRLAGVVIALVLIVGGIMAIGRSVLGTGSPTMIY